MGLFKRYVISGEKFKISDLSKNDSISVYDIERYLQMQNKTHIIADVEILFVQNGEVTTQWIEGRDRHWWRAVKNICGF